MTYEYCTVCDNKTGKAGCGDGSLYTNDGSGPFCEVCYHWTIKLKDLEERILKLEPRPQMCCSSKHKVGECWC